MKKILLIIGLVSASLYATAIDFSGSATLTNDYIWRGVSQGQGNALQVGGEVESHGAYLGVWTSNVDFDDTSRETDYYGGYSFPIWTDHINADFGYIEFDYDNNASNFEEFYGSVELVDIGLELFYAQTTGEGADNFASAEWTIPFIDFVDVGVIYNYFEEDETQILYSLSRDFDRYSLSLLGGEDFVTKESFISVSVGVSI